MYFTRSSSIERASQMSWIPSQTRHGPGRACQTELCQHSHSQEIYTLDVYRMSMLIMVYDTFVV